MSAKKIVAILAVIVMITCPLAVAFVNTDAASEKSDVTEMGTTISLKNLDKDGILQLLGKEKSTDASDSNSIFPPYTRWIATILGAVFAPGVNMYAFTDAGTPGLVGGLTWDVNNVDIDVTYYREVVKDKEYTVKVALDINVKDFEVVLDDEYMSEVAKTKLSVLLTDYSEAEIAQFIWAVSENEISETAAIWIAKALKAAVTGDYANGIDSAFSGLKFNASEMKLTGSSHVKAFIECGATVEKVTVGGESYYVVLDSGIMPITVRPKVGNQPETEVATEQILYSLSIKKIALEMNNVLSVEQDGLTPVTFKTDLNADVQFDRTFKYANEDLEDMVESAFKWDSEYDTGKQSDKDKQATKYTSFVDPVVKIAVDTTADIDGKSYRNNGIAIDLSDVVKKVFNDRPGFAVDSLTYAASYCCIQPEEGSFEVFEYWGFGYLFKPSTDLMDVQVSWILNKLRFSESETTNEDIDEPTARQLITDLGGTYSYEPSTALKTVNSIQDAIEGKTSKDNSMLILAIVVIVIAILAIIAFAMIVRHKA